MSESNLSFSYNDGIEDDPKQLQDDPPPFLGRWPRVYLAILSYVALVIAALYFLSVSFAY